MRELAEAIERAKSAEEYKKRIADLFKYETLDEANPSEERSRRDVTVELGGPCVHAKLVIMTRTEHTILREALDKIIGNRLVESNQEIDELCKERIKENP